MAECPGRSLGGGLIAQSKTHHELEPHLHPCAPRSPRWAEVRFGDVMSLDSLSSVAFKDTVDVVVSCLASRTGGQRCGAGVA